MASDEDRCTNYPDYAVICSFIENFDEKVKLTFPDIDELQILLEDTDNVNPLLAKLFGQLLRRINKSVKFDKWERGLQRFAHSYSHQDGWELERFGFKKSKLECKIRVFKHLLEAQFDLYKSFKDKVNLISAKDLRLQPCGRDKHGVSYWCQLDKFANLRIYKDDQDDETWTLVARSREELVSLIDELQAASPPRSLARETSIEESQSEAPTPVDSKAPTPVTSGRTSPVLDTGQPRERLKIDASEINEEKGINDLKKINLLSVSDADDSVKINIDVSMLKKTVKEEVDKRLQVDSKYTNVKEVSSEKITLKRETKVTDIKESNLPESEILLDLKLPERVSLDSLTNLKESSKEQIPPCYKTEATEISTAVPHSYKIGPHLKEGLHSTNEVSTPSLSCNVKVPKQTNTHSEKKVPIAFTESQIKLNTPIVTAKPVKQGILQSPKKQNLIKEASPTLPEWVKNEFKKDFSHKVSDELMSESNKELKKITSTSIHPKDPMPLADKKSIELKGISDTKPQNVLQTISAQKMKSEKENVKGNFTSTNTEVAQDLTMHAAYPSVSEQPSVLNLTDATDSFQAKDKALNASVTQINFKNDSVLHDVKSSKIERQDDSNSALIPAMLKDSDEALNLTSPKKISFIDTNKFGKDSQQQSKDKTSGQMKDKPEKKTIDQIFSLQKGKQLKQIVHPDNRRKESQSEELSSEKVYGAISDIPTDLSKFPNKHLPLQCNKPFIIKDQSLKSKILNKNRYEGEKDEAEDKKEPSCSIAGGNIKEAVCEPETLKSFDKVIKDASEKISTSATSPNQMDSSKLSSNILAAGFVDVNLKKSNNTTDMMPSNGGSLNLPEDLSKHLESGKSLPIQGEKLDLSVSTAFENVSKPELHLKRGSEVLIETKKCHKTYVTKPESVDITKTSHLESILHEKIQDTELTEKKSEFMATENTKSGSIAGIDLSRLKSESTSRKDQHEAESSVGKYQIERKSSAKKESYKTESESDSVIKKAYGSAESSTKEEKGSCKTESYICEKPNQSELSTCKDNNKLEINDGKESSITEFGQKTLCKSLPSISEPNENVPDTVKDHSKIETFGSISISNLEFTLSKDTSKSDTILNKISSNVSEESIKPEAIMSKLSFKSEAISSNLPLKSEAIESKVPIKSEAISSQVPFKSETTISKELNKVEHTAKIISFKPETSTGIGLVPNKSASNSSIDLSKQKQAAGKQHIKTGNTVCEVLDKSGTTSIVGKVLIQNEAIADQETIKHETANVVINPETYAVIESNKAEEINNTEGVACKLFSNPELSNKSETIISNVPNVLEKLSSNVLNKSETLASELPIRFETITCQVKCVSETIPDTSSKSTPILIMEQSEAKTIECAAPSKSETLVCKEFSKPDTNVGKEPIKSESVASTVQSKPESTAKKGSCKSETLASKESNKSGTIASEAAVKEQDKPDRPTIAMKDPSKSEITTVKESFISESFPSQKPFQSEIIAIKELSKSENATSKELSKTEAMLSKEPNKSETIASIVTSKSETITSKDKEPSKSDDIPSEDKNPSKSDDIASKEPSKSEIITTKEPMKTETIASKEPSESEKIVTKEPSKPETVANKVPVPFKSETVANRELIKSEIVVSQETNKSETIITKEPSKPETVENKEPSKSEIVANKEHSKSETVSSQEPSKSETFANKELLKSETVVSQEPSRPKSETIESKKISKSEANTSKEPLQYASITGKEYNKSKTVAWKDPSKSEPVANKESNKSEIIPSKECSKSETMANKEPFKSETAASKELCKSETIASMEISKSEANVSKVPLQAESITSKESYKSKTVAWKDPSKSEPVANKESNKSEIIPSKECSKSETMANKEPFKSETAASKELCKSETIASMEISKSEANVSKVPLQAESITSKESYKSKTVAWKDPSKSEPVANKESSKSEIISSKEHSKSETMANKEPFKSETVASKEPCKSETVASKEITKSEATVSKEPLQFESIMSKESNKSKTVALKDPSKSEPVANKESSKSENISCKEHSKSETTANKEPFKSETFASKELCKSETIASKKPSKSEFIAGKEQSKPESITLKEPNTTPEPVVNKESSKSEIISSKELSKSETIASKEPCKSEAITSKEPNKSETISIKDPCKYEFVANKEFSKSETIVSKEPSKFVSITSIDPSKLETIGSKEPRKSEPVANKDPSKSETIAIKESYIGLSESISSKGPSISETIANRELSKSETVARKEPSKSETMACKELSKTETISSIVTSKSETVANKEPSKLESVTNKEPCRTETISSKVPNRSETISSMEPLKSVTISSKEASKSQTFTSIVSGNSETISDKGPSKSEAIASKESCKSEIIASITTSKSVAISKTEPYKSETTGGKFKSNVELGQSDTIATEEPCHSDPKASKPANNDKELEKQEAFSFLKVSKSELDTCKEHSVKELMKPKVSSSYSDSNAEKDSSKSQSFSVEKHVKSFNTNIQPCLSEIVHPCKVESNIKKEITKPGVITSRSLNKSENVDKDLSKPESVSVEESVQDKSNSSTAPNISDSIEAPWKVELNISKDTCRPKLDDVSKSDTNANKELCKPGPDLVKELNKSESIFSKDPSKSDSDAMKLPSKSDCVKTKDLSKPESSLAKEPFSSSGSNKPTSNSGKCHVESNIGNDKCKVTGITSNSDFVSNKDPINRDASKFPIITKFAEKVSSKLQPIGINESEPIACKLPVQNVESIGSLVPNASKITTSKAPSKSELIASKASSVLEPISNNDPNLLKSVSKKVLSKTQAILSTNVPSELESIKSKVPCKSDTNVSSKSESSAVKIPCKSELISSKEPFGNEPLASKVPLCNQKAGTIDDACKLTVQSKLASVTSCEHNKPKSICGINPNSPSVEPAKFELKEDKPIKLSIELESNDNKDPLNKKDIDISSKIESIESGTASCKKDDSQVDSVTKSEAEPSGTDVEVGKVLCKNSEQPEKDLEEAIEEPVMIVTGEREGALCEGGNTWPSEDVQSTIPWWENFESNSNSGPITDVIEEVVLYFWGEGNGADCDAGNSGDEGALGAKPTRSSRRQTRSVIKKPEPAIQKNSVENSTEDGDNENKLNGVRNNFQSKDSVETLPNCTDSIVDSVVKDSVKIVKDNKVSFSEDMDSVKDSSKSSNNKVDSSDSKQVPDKNNHSESDLCVKVVEKENDENGPSQSNADDLKENESKIEPIIVDSNRPIPIPNEKISKAVLDESDNEAAIEEKSSPRRKRGRVRGRPKKSRQVIPKRKRSLTHENDREESSDEEDGRGRNQLSPLPEAPSQRQRSARIAKIREREETERRELEGQRMRQIAEENRLRELKKKARVERHPIADEPFTESLSNNKALREIKKQKKEKKKDKKKKKKKKKVKKVPTGTDPWNHSSSSSSSSSEEDFMDMDLIDNEELVFKSDHEFSPESDIGEEDAQPIKRARTAKKMDIVAKVTAAPEEESDYDDTECIKCGHQDHPETILLCDSCDNGWHISCLRPPLFSVPEGDWSCPTCEHSVLIEKLKEILEQFDATKKKAETEELRKQRLAYINVSLDNVIPDKKKKHKNEEDEGSESDSEESDSDSDSGSDSSSSTGAESDSSSPALYTLRARPARTPKEQVENFDELINEAIRDEMEAALMSKKSSNVGRGKDISTIVEGEKEECMYEEEEEEEEKEEEEVGKGTGKEMRMEEEENERLKKKEDIISKQVEIENEAAEVKKSEKDEIEDAKEIIAPKKEVRIAEEDDDEEVAPKRKKQKLNNENEDGEAVIKDDGSDYEASEPETPPSRNKKKKGSKAFITAKKRRRLTDLDVEEEEDDSDEDFMGISEEDEEEEEASEAASSDFDSESESDDSGGGRGRSGRYGIVPLRRSTRNTRNASMEDYDSDDKKSKKQKKKKKKKKKFSTSSEEEEYSSDSEGSYAKKRKTSRKRAAPRRSKGKKSSSKKKKGSKKPPSKKRKLEEEEGDGEEKPKPKPRIKYSKPPKTKEELQQEEVSQRRVTRGRQINYYNSLLMSDEDFEDEEEKPKSRGKVMKGERVSESSSEFEISDDERKKRRGVSGGLGKGKVMKGEEEEEEEEYRKKKKKKQIIEEGSPLRGKPTSAILPPKTLNATEESVALNNTEISENPPTTDLPLKILSEEKTVAPTIPVVVKGPLTINQAPIRMTVNRPGALPTPTLLRGGGPGSRPRHPAPNHANIENKIYNRPSAPSARFTHGTQIQVATSPTPVASGMSSSVSITPVSYVPNPNVHTQPQVRPNSVTMTPRGPSPRGPRPQVSTLNTSIPSHVTITRGPRGQVPLTAVTMPPNLDRNSPPMSAIRGPISLHTTANGNRLPLPPTTSVAKVEIRNTNAPLPPVTIANSPPITPRSTPEILPERQTLPPITSSKRVAPLGRDSPGPMQPMGKWSPHISGGNGGASTPPHHGVAPGTPPRTGIGGAVNASPPPPYRLSPIPVSVSGAGPQPPNTITHRSTPPNLPPTSTHPSGYPSYPPPEHFAAHPGYPPGYHPGAAHSPVPHGPPQRHPLPHPGSIPPNHPMYGPPVPHGSYQSLPPHHPGVLRGPIHDLYRHSPPNHPRPLLLKQGYPGLEPLPYAGSPGPIDASGRHSSPGPPPSTKEPQAPPSKKASSNEGEFSSGLMSYFSSQREDDVE